MKKSFISILVTFFALTGPYFGLDDSTLPDQQEQTQLRHEVKVTLKLVQVYVTDKKGNPVLDLEQRDFLIFDENKKQTTTEFERHVLSLPSGAEDAQFEVKETPPLPYRELLPRKFFLFFDFAYNNGIGIEKSRKAALHFIDTQLQPQDEVGVLSYSAIKSLKLHEYLTTDHQKVREVAGKFRLEQIAGRAEDFEAGYWQAVTGENPKDASRSGAVDDRGDATTVRRDRKESENQTLRFAQRMIDLSKALRYIPGHKHIVLFSSGVPYSIVYGNQSPYGNAAISDLGNPGLRFKYEDMLKELSAANCTIYALDTQEPTRILDQGTAWQGRYTLEKMASATGGKYFGNINYYERHIEKIQDLTGCYYVLGYYVDDKWDGAYHKIKVEVSQPGCKVHAQKGYFNPKPFTEYNDLEKMLHLVDLALSEEPLLQTPVRFPLEVVPFEAAGKANLCLTAEILVDKIQEVLKDKTEIIGLIFDEKENIVAFKRNEREGSLLTGERFSFSASFSLPQGTYKCRLVIRNLETGRGAVASATAGIPSR
jgi:VWFA-related protein